MFFLGCFFFAVRQPDCAVHIDTLTSAIDFLFSWELKENKLQLIMWFLQAYNYEKGDLAFACYNKKKQYHSIFYSILSSKFVPRF